MHQYEQNLYRNGVVLGEVYYMLFLA